MASSSGVRGSGRHKAQHISVRTPEEPRLCNLAFFSTKTSRDRTPRPKQRPIDWRLFPGITFGTDTPGALECCFWWGGATFVDGDDVRVAERGHDLDLPADVNQVLLILDLLLSDRLYGNLENPQSKNGFISNKSRKGEQTGKLLSHSVIKKLKGLSGKASWQSNDEQPPRKGEGTPGQIWSAYCLQPGRRWAP